MASVLCSNRSQLTKPLINVSSRPKDISTAVVIVSYNGAPWICGCVQSVVDGADDVHVIVVDNASTDGTAGLVAAEFPIVELIALDQNVGFGLGNNIGIQRALALGARFVLLLNQDAFMTPGGLAELQRYMDAEPAVGVCTPLHCSPDTSRLDPRTYRNYLATHADGLLLDALHGNLSLSYQIPGINAAVWFVRSDVFRTVGGFDPLFFMYGEDDDLLNRMRFHHVRFALLPHVVAVHLRQSPVRQKGNAFHEFRLLVDRDRATLLMRVKNPNYSALFSLRVLASYGLVRPVADLLLNSDWKECLVSWWATLRVLFEFRRTRRHTLATRVRGAHYLGERVP